jgi:hypothetical protein
LHTVLVKKNPEGKRPIDLDGRIILKQILETQDGRSVNCILLAYWPNVVNTAMKHLNPPPPNLGISRVAEQLATSQTLRTVELVICRLQ